jgi:hypothetical protein
MELKPILLAFVISVAYYIIKFYSRATTYAGKMSISVISNSEGHLSVKLFKHFKPIYGFLKYFLN